MEKQTFSLIFLIAIASIAKSIAQPITHGSISISNLLTIPTPIVTQLQFYLQAVDVGRNETEYRIANSSITNQSPTRFGFLDMFDDLLTEGPQPISNAIGRAQGMIGSADLTTLAFFIHFNAYFASGLHNGSTLNIAGRFPPTSGFNELSVVGGTRDFRLAKGIVTSRDVSEDKSTLNAVVEFNLTVIHYPTL